MSERRPAASGLEDAFGEGNHENFARRPAQDEVDGRREEARLPTPARRGADDDQVDVTGTGLLHDCVADRARSNDLGPHLDPVVLSEHARFLERGFDPFREYVKRVDALFEELLTAIETETSNRALKADMAGFDPARRGATWTYITTDQPFGTWMQSALREFLKRRMKE